MARPQASPILEQLRSAKSHHDQAVALQALKNEVVGHLQNKEIWIGSGILEPIIRALVSEASSPKLHGKDAIQLISRQPSEQDAVKLQALQLVGSFANGGPAFLHPLLAAQAVPAVLSNISPFSNPPQTVVAALRALLGITKATALAGESSPLALNTLADTVFTPQNIQSINAMLSMTSSKHIFQTEIALASVLISRLCLEDRHQHALVAAGVLDSLAAQLARFAVSDGLVVPGAEELAFNDGIYEVFPEPAAPGAQIGHVLEAISVILGDSRYRAQRLVHSPSMLAIFPCVKFEPAKDVSTPRQALTAMEYILPSLPTTVPRTPSAPQSSFNTPDRAESRASSRASLTRLASSSAWESLRSQPAGNGGDPVEDIESPLIPWLIHLVRTLQDYERLMAASVLATLFRAGLGRKTVREQSIGLLVVPIVVGMIAKNDNYDADTLQASDSPQRQILEKAPAILARLIADSEYLQKAAFDCEAVKVLTKLLKHSYEPVAETREANYWSPNPEMGMDVENASLHAQIGERGQDPVLSHKIRVRESALKAIGALSAGKEDYRKELVNEDVVRYVAESLCEFPGKPKQAKELPKDKSWNEPVSSELSLAYGKNPVAVIIAACHVVRTLARSVSILRTALVDYGVALPMFRFMRHPDVEVQIAATATVINLVVEVSPVREPLTGNGVMKVLCEHAHSNNPTLRLNALWALKHFVDAVGPELKKTCLEQLEPGWLVQLISDNSQDFMGLTNKSKELESDDLDEDMDMQVADEPIRWFYGTNGVIRELDASQSTRLRQVEDKLALVRETELNPARKARSDDLAIQEQGLDFIRNLIGRPESGLSSETPSETTEMIDCLFNELGQDRLFEILASKLRSRVLHPFLRRTASSAGATGRDGSAARIVHPQAKIISAVIFILVHMAASIPRHRQLVISQTELLRLLAQQASSKDRGVRASLCHLVINLTWQEDESEAQACAQRASELKKLGFYGKMELLKHQDRDLDVRERAKTAAWQIEQATY